MDSLIQFVQQDLGNPGLAALLSNPSFAFIQLMNSFSQAMNLFIIAAGLSLIFGVLRVINFAHGAFYMFGAYIVYSVAQEWTGNFWLGVAAAGLGLAVMAVVIERGLFQYIYDKEHLMQLLLTFAVVLILSDVAKIIWGTDQYSVSYPASMKGAVDLGVTFYPTYRLFLIVVGPAIAIGLWLFTERTRFGRLTRAATQDREMLSALGVNVPIIYTGVFILGSVLAGIGGGSRRALQLADARHGCDDHRGLLRHRHRRRPRLDLGQLHRRDHLRARVQLRLGDRAQLAGRVPVPDPAGGAAHPAVGPVRQARGRQRLR